MQKGGLVGRRRLEQRVWDHSDTSSPWRAERAERAAGAGAGGGRDLYVFGFGHDYRGWDAGVHCHRGPDPDDAVAFLRRPVQPLLAV